MNRLQLTAVVLTALVVTSCGKKKQTNDIIVPTVRVFTKADFVAQLDDDYRKTGILEGIVYDKTDGNNIIFAGSVSHPQTDEYIPLVVSVSNFGEVSIRRDDQMDTSGSLPAEEPNPDDEGV